MKLHQQGLLSDGMMRLHAAFPEASTSDIYAAIVASGDHLGLARLKLHRQFRVSVSSSHLVVGTRVEHASRGLGYVVHVGNDHGPYKVCMQCAMYILRGVTQAHFTAMQGAFRQFGRDP